MIFSNKKMVIKSVKAGVLRSVSIKDFRPIRSSRIEIFRAICIPPFYDFPKKFNLGALAKPMKKFFILTAAVFAVW